MRAVDLHFGHLKCRPNKRSSEPVSKITRVGPGFLLFSCCSAPVVGGTGVLSPSVIDDSNTLGRFGDGGLVSGDDEELPLQSRPEKSTLTFFPRVRDKGVSVHEDNDESPSIVHASLFCSRAREGAFHLPYLRAVDS